VPVLNVLALLGVVNGWVGQADTAG
jgi:hypothetical protein